jgi:hypothetical protein
MARLQQTWQPIARRIDPSKWNTFL